MQAPKMRRRTLPVYPNIFNYARLKLWTKSFLNPVSLCKMCNYMRANLQGMKLTKETMSKQGSTTLKL